MSDPLDVVDLRTRVQRSLDMKRSTAQAVLAPLGPDMDHLVSCVFDLLRGGKRLRAAFFYWGYRAASGPDSDALVRAASSMEVFQAAALLHDDVMDRSSTRRGMPTAHRRLARLHRERGWAGDSDRFGEAGAILAGDLCLNWTDEIYSTSGLPQHELSRGRPLFDTMRTQLMGGQFLDVIEAASTWDGVPTAQRVERALRVIAFKSAKYTVEQPLLIGATCAGADEVTLARLSDYGLALGEAFQLRDDLLGVFGDPAITGKPAGDDLREGKRTVLVAYALDRATSEELTVFADTFGHDDLTDDQVRALRDICERTGAVERTESLIAQRVGAAERHLESAAIDPDGRAMLRELIEISTARTA